ncbi:phospho-N-acetylmuramoyl-pentapeptide-transferase [Sphingobacterium mizutaii NBRC 14946 = DSM 11724]|uniref:Phospho-N-acetylmuramoyl-pentapeptide-transferase n=2 Tax=Sphingobacterium mizutaii TaxID=1010 RepID=A0AAJ4XEP2_9SPHI|nr:phospho-N-acetylmuramoyl-pentapeptide-transferase [Sphingobacterium mizutaii]GEM67331.1 phospho-N-acetylmuramoyl-pentapeptide-transferase [Sphingobacterium mizutaii NBRC 14946 = DSM 11724]SDL31171.1 Phospho-N-acetylmuramoyl-pentapeptide-transferase [Sphingobacterium mizutaii]SNV54531.1 Phospho-N-acetylmuramoyl-pentapeptide-transferase [Sphingobacterium mizutaii]
MLYYLFTWLNEHVHIPGAGLFQYISFRTAMAVILSLIITTVFGSRLIRLLHQKQVGETIRDLGLEGEKKKQGTPTMGGLIIIAGILIPTLLFAKLDNIYIILMIITTIWMGAIGFLDDYIKVFRKNKEGLAGKFKVIGQVGLGVLIAITMYFHPEIVARQQVANPTSSKPVEVIINPSTGEKTYAENVKSTKTNIPFYKNNEFDYAKVLDVFGVNSPLATFFVFLVVVVFIITAVSNGANITDGIDGLATGTSAIMGITLAILAYVSGNIIFADYLNIMFIPNSGELVIFAGAFVGACTGFLWYNAYPAQVFMGDTGSLAIGGIIAAFAILIRKELLIPVLCGIFLIENLSVILQVSYFKYTKKKYGEGRRIFLMSPLHHHYQKKGYHESKIVTRFVIVSIMLAILTIVTLKVR